MSALRAALAVGETSGEPGPEVVPVMRFDRGTVGTVPGVCLVFYRGSAEGVDAVRILHQRMDPTLHL
jgi:plasmid stabilization system protein ParE